MNAVVSTRRQIILTLIGKDIYENLRNRWFLILSLLLIILTLAVSVLGLSGMGKIGIGGFGKTAASLINLVMLIVPLMGLMLGATSLANEKETGTLVILLAQPVTPFEVYLAKFLALSFLLFASITIGYGLNALLIGYMSAYTQIQVFLIFAGVTVVLGCIFIALGMFISSLSSKVSTSLGVSLFIWIGTLFLSDLGIMTATIVLKIKPQTLFWITVINPLQSFRTLVLDILHGDLELLGPAGRYALHTLGSKLPSIMFLILIIWVCVGLGFGAWIFSKKKVYT